MTKEKLIKVMEVIEALESDDEMKNGLLTACNSMIYAEDQLIELRQKVKNIEPIVDKLPEEALVSLSYIKENIKRAEEIQSKSYDKLIDLLFKIKLSEMLSA